jgi:hypothetical protein
VFAEFETNLRRERQPEGIDKAKAAGVYRRRPASIGQVTFASQYGGRKTNRPTRSAWNERTIGEIKTIDVISSIRCNTVAKRDIRMGRRSHTSREPIKAPPMIARQWAPTPGPAGRSALNGLAGRATDALKSRSSFSPNLILERNRCQQHRRRPASGARRPLAIPASPPPTDWTACQQCPQLRVYCCIAASEVMGQQRPSPNSSIRSPHRRRPAASAAPSVRAPWRS